MQGGGAPVQHPHLELVVDDAELLPVLDVAGGDGELPGQPACGVAVQRELAQCGLDEVVDTPPLLAVAQVQKDGVVQN